MKSGRTRSGSCALYTMIGCSFPLAWFFITAIIYGVFMPHAPDKCPDDFPVVVVSPSDDTAQIVRYADLRQHLAAYPDHSLRVPPEKVEMYKGKLKQAYGHDTLISVEELPNGWQSMYVVVSSMIDLHARYETDGKAFRHTAFHGDPSPPPSGFFMAPLIGLAVTLCLYCLPLVLRLMPKIRDEAVKTDQ